MLIFDEKKYAQEILKDKSFKTYKQRDIERYILIRYLASEGFSLEDIKDKLKDFSIIGCEYLDKKDIDIIYEKIINKALSCELVTGINVMILKKELEIINNIEDENARNLLFVLLVYYKWAVTQNYLYFYSKRNNSKMVVVNDIDCWKLANLMKLRVADRYKISNYLINKGLYVEDNFKSKNYFYLPFCENSGEVAILISDDCYDNIIGELYFYNDEKHYKRCEICKKVIKKTRSPKKYCDRCAYRENIKKTSERKKNLKTQCPKTPIE